MKKIDRLLLTSFIGPFLVSFGIALFILIMQFLWLYIDEIAGKGVSLIVLLELLGYMSISVFPMALPIAVLLASVMVMGNLAERYELSSIKSAGVSLTRVMLPLMFVCAGVAVFSFTCYNYLIPISTLKFRTRLFDIRKQKPALSIEKGVFNEDFRSFIIRVGDKKQDGEIIEDVLIEDQTSSNKLKFSQILADSGAMYTTDDKRFFVMQLYNGAQYQEPVTGSLQKSQYPFIRTRFKSWQKVWDMREFEMNSSDPERFKSQRSMLTMDQLNQSIDSLQKVMQNSRMAIVDDIMINPKRKAVKPPSVVQVAPPQDTLRAKKSARLATQLSAAPQSAASSTTASDKPKPKPTVYRVRAHNFDEPSHL